MRALQCYDFKNIFAKKEEEFFYRKLVKTAYNCNHNNGP
jgi:hypothetical protein